MTEMLEPAPMLGDGNEYGGPMIGSQSTNQYNNYNINNNDNAESDIEINLENSDNSDSSTMQIPIRNHNKETDATSTKGNIKVSFKDDQKHEEEAISSASDNSNKGFITDNNPRISNKSDQLATSAGIILGERDSNIKDRYRIGTLSSDRNIISENDKYHMDNMSEKHNREYRVGYRRCCSDFYSRLYSYPRLRIFLSFLYLFISLILCYGDIFGALWISNEIWNFKYPNANTEYHELWFAILLILIFAPYIISWGAHLIFIEEKLSKQNNKIKFIKYPIIILYLITPIGIVFILIYELLYIYLYSIINLLFYRFLFRRPSYKMIMNIKKTKGSRAYIRFRKITHMLSSSIPLMLYYGYLYYWDPYPRLKWKYLSCAAFISLLNTLFTILSFLSDAKSINISLLQYFILSLRLFGGFIPKLLEIRSGNIKRINYSLFAFGNYSYAKFADVIESTNSKLETIILTHSTLSDLSQSLCYQLGSVCKSKNINIIILKNYSPYVVWFKYLFPNPFMYKVTLKNFKQAFRTCDIFGDKSEEEFDLLENDLDKLYGKHNDNKYYYYRDFVNDWNGFEEENNYNYNDSENNKSYGSPKFGKQILGMFHRLLRILPPHIVDNNNKHTKEDIIGRDRNERLLNLVLGRGNINEIDPINKTSALFYAIIQEDIELINRLCDNGAKTSKDVWQKIGEYIIQLVKDNKFITLKKLIKLIKQKREIECDLTYHDIDGKTAVIYSAINGNIEILQLLINANLGADLLHVDQNGNTAVDYANEYKHIQLEQYLRNQFL